MVCLLGFLCSQMVEMMKGDSAGNKAYDFPVRTFKINKRKAVE